MEKLIWRTEKRKISELIPFEGNPRQMTEKERDDLKKVWRSLIWWKYPR